LAEYSIRFQHLGQRASFALGSSEKDAAATKARDIYIFLKANGWEATFAKYKPKPITHNKLTVSQFLAAVRETGKLNLRTFLNYENCLHFILARVFGIKDTNAKYDYRNGGNQNWRNRIGAIRLEKLKPELVASWMKKSIVIAGSSPTAITAAKRTANSYVRCARSLFSLTILKEPSVRKLSLPNPLPFQGVELFETGSTRYISKIDAQTLIAAAKKELKTEDEEAYKIFLLGLLGGMRKGEIDLCEWRMIDWKNNIIRLEETEWLRLKTPDSAGEITIDSEVLSELRKFMPASESPFIVSSVVKYRRGPNVISRIRPPRPESVRRYYRCEPVFKRLYQWLRAKGVIANKPLHELRKEIGALIATKHGIFAASTYLRHADITTTARHYADHKTRISAGLGKHLRTSLKVSKARSAVSRQLRPENQHQIDRATAS
jgi:integrase